MARALVLCRQTKLPLFRGIRPVTRAGAVRDVLAGFTLAAMNVPQALGYTRIAGTPVVTGLYSLLLPHIEAVGDHGEFVGLC